MSAAEAPEAKEHVVQMECRSWMSCPSYGERRQVPLAPVVPGVLARPAFICADCGMELLTIVEEGGQ